MSPNPLQRLGELGQSVWYDFIRRDLYQGPELKRLIEQDGLRGMTSNPTIFQKAIAESSLYDDDIRSAGEAGKDPAAIFESLAVADVRAAADIFRPVYDATGGEDGFVSIEVGPRLARDTPGTIAEARRLWSSCGRPNVMVKIPGTAEGVPAIRQCLSEGININITLLFSVPRYREVMDAYYRSARGARAAQGEDRPHPLGRELLRLPGGHQRRQEAGRAHRRTASARRGSGVDPGEARGRERAARVPGVPGGLRRAAVRRAEGRGRDAPAAAVGLDVDEGPVAARPLLRRGAHRGDVGRHHAARDVRGVQGPRRSRRSGSPTTCRERTPPSRRSRSSASTSAPWRGSSRTRASRSSPTRSMRC